MQKKSHTQTTGFTSGLTVSTQYNSMGFHNSDENRKHEELKLSPTLSDTNENENFTNTKRLSPYFPVIDDFRSPNKNKYYINQMNKAFQDILQKPSGGRFSNLTKEQSPLKKESSEKKKGGYRINKSTSTILSHYK